MKSKQRVIKERNEENKLLKEGTFQDFPDNAHRARIYPVIFSPDGKYIVSASMDRTIKLWNAKNKSLVSSFIYQNIYRNYPGKAHKDRIFSLSLSPDGRYLASGS